MTHVVLVGATKGMGRSLSRLLAARGDSLFLLGRDEGDLAATAADLKLRGASKVGWALLDLEDSSGFDPALNQVGAAGPVDWVVVTAADFASQDLLEEDGVRLEALLRVNFTGTILFCEAARKKLLRDGGGLCVFGSVAGDRGRKPVGLYGSTKAGLHHYLESLDHRYHGEGLTVLTVKPGFVRTSMTAGLSPPPFAGDPDAVARQVLKAMNRRKVLLYTPSIWWWVMTVIRWLPRFVMRRIGF